MATLPALSRFALPCTTTVSRSCNPNSSCASFAMTLPFWSTNFTTTTESVSSAASQLQPSSQQLPLHSIEAQASTNTNAARPFTQGSIPPPTDPTTARVSPSLAFSRSSTTPMASDGSSARLNCLALERADSALGPHPANPIRTIATV